MASDGGPLTLLVASAGGHIDELHRLSARIEGLESGGAVWVCSENAQTRTLLGGRKVVWTRHVGPRGLWRAVWNLIPAFRLIRGLRVGHVITTGAAFALPYIVAARAAGVRTSYIESAARQKTPSLTGSIAARVPGVRLYSQADAGLGPRWVGIGSVFDGYQSRDRDRVDPSVGRVVVSLGGERFPFTRAVDRLREIIPSGVDILWQTGATPAAGLRGEVHEWVDPARLSEAMAAADVVIVHSGVGSALAALDAGKIPVLLVRRAAHGEHVDDHQSQIAEELRRRGLAVVCDPSALTWSHVVDAANVVADRKIPIPPIDLA